MVSYVLRLDDTPSPNTTIAALMLQVLSDTIVTGFIPDSVPLSALSSVVLLLSIQVIIYSYLIILATLVQQIDGRFISIFITLNIHLVAGDLWL